MFSWRRRRRRRKKRMVSGHNLGGSCGRQTEREKERERLGSATG